MIRMIRLLVVGAAFGCLACSGALIRPALPSAERASEALLILPGFGYNRSGEQTFRKLAPELRAGGIDLYLPAYVSRSGLEESRAKLLDFIREQRLSRYDRVHVFAFIAGGWTLNPLVDARALPNLATVVYDRSPYQERAPKIARDKLRLLTWLRYGPVVFDLADTSYHPVTAPTIRVGLLIETKPTSFIRRHAEAAAQQGPYRFDCGSFGQRYEDCAYVGLDHDELYVRFAEVWPEVRAFIRTGRFTPGADRKLPKAFATGPERAPTDTRY